MTLRFGRRPVWPVIGLLVCTVASAQTAKKVSFATDVAPILAKNCAQCHGPAPAMANLDLRSRDAALKGGQHGPAIVPGDAAGSRLYQHLTGQVQPQMPMGGRLTDAETAVIKAWIDSGAEWDSAAPLNAAAPAPDKTAAAHKFTDQQRKYWAFQKVTKPPVPAVSARNPIDAFVLAKLATQNLKPNPPADKITLLRRANLDLTGLPPSPEDTQAFLADNSPSAFEKVVDRLLASPQYGERWGRHWLDLARYADSAGFKADETRPNVWRYRDYVIQSFNEDKPYDRFVKEQIAGDELYPDDPAARIATGFDRLWPDESNLANPILRRQEILNDITDTVGAVFMGMTYGCARCHDHKFDPILQKDYYRLQAFFANIRNDDHASLLTGDQAAAYQRQRTEWETQTREIRAKMDTLLASVRVERLKEDIGMFPKEAQDAVFTPPEQRTPMQWQMYYRSASRLPSNRELERALKGDAKQQYADLQKGLAQFDSLKPADPPVAEAIFDGSRNAPPEFVLFKGVWDAPLDEVQPGVLSILDPAPAKIVAPEGLNSTGRRSALANWLTDPKNPLTARVMVNRIWQDHFGKGIVGTSSDFGVMGERPADPQLLDYLATSFVENGWSIKKMHRLIMLSTTYQQSSAYQEQAAKVDPDNKLLWRFDRRRLEGEVIRDSMLMAAGQLNLKMGGPGVFPPIPQGISNGSKYLAWTAEKDPAEADRRSVYVFVKRNLRYPMFEAYDFPDTSESCPRRYATVSPTQPLVGMNDDLIRQWSRELANRVLNDAGLSPDQQVERAFRVVFNRAPKDDERQAVLDFLNKQAGEIGGETARAAAFVDFCQALLNSNEFLCVN
ncbi:MAG TPA: PSD1 and planctomycete cytochrome C domain-containing protein [Bryobacteraceae bacterium]|nr:PSD1 and planctomycete cytochrome C domain-containing protein [Bryobacteraceae bacterium]